MCLSQYFLSADQNGQCDSVSFRTSHNPTQTSAACPEVFYTSSMGSASPTWMPQASWAYQMGCTGTFSKKIFPTQAKHTAVLPFLKPDHPQTSGACQELKWQSMTNILTYIYIKILKLKHKSIKPLPTQTVKFNRNVMLY